MNPFIRARVNLSFVFAGALVLSACGGGSGDAGGSAGTPDVPVIPATNEAADATDIGTGSSPVVFGPGFNEPTAEPAADDDAVVVLDPPTVEEAPVVFSPSVVEDQPIVIDPPTFEDPPVARPPVVDDPPIVMEPQIIDEPPEVIDDPEPPIPEVLELVGADSDSGFLETDDLVIYETSTATSIILLSNSGDADLLIFETGGDEVCRSVSVDPIDACSNLVVGTSYLVGVAAFSAADYEIFSLDTPFVDGNFAFTGEVQTGDNVLLFGSGFTAINLTSFSGDADLDVISLANENVCSSVNTGDFDSCNNVDESSDPALSRDEQYVVIVNGFEDASYELQTFDTDVLQSNVAVESFVALSEDIDYFARDVSTIELATLSGDADIVVFNASTNVVACVSDSVGLDADVCTVPTGNYRILVFGFQASDFTLTAF